MNTLESVVRGCKRGLGLTSSSLLVAKIRPVYHSLLSLCYRQRGLTRQINGQECIRIRPAHRNAHEDYEPAVFHYLKTKVRPGATVLDVGAHVGLFTVLLARWAGPKGQVFAFEPTPLTRTALIDHLTLNDVAGQVTVCPFAVSDKEGSSAVYTVSNSPENTLSPIHGRLPNAEAVEIEVTTLDAFCGSRRIRPDLIKIDIEGFELHALRGAKQILVHHRPTVVVEMHPMNWPEIGVTREQAAGLLGELNYRMIPLDDQRDPLAEYGHIVLEPSSER
jgi:FkbM family methyltransferase